MWIGTACSVVALFAACDGNNGADPTPPASPTTAPTAVPTAPLPDRPASLADYPQTLADYGTAVSDAAQTCFASVLAAWDMPAISPADGCRRANTDSDADDEFVLAVSADVLDPLSGTSVPSFVVIVLDPTDGGLEPAFQSSIYPLPPDGTSTSPILDAGDLNGDGTGEFAFTSQYCGEAACFDLAYILEGGADGYEAIGPADGIGIAEGAFSFADENGDGAKELLATGGAISSTESGPQRPRTEVWAWDGTAYALRETRPGESQYLYHHVLAADAILDGGDYTSAEEAYLALTEDDALLLWKPEQNEREEVTAYALYRAGLAHLLGGGDTATAIVYLERAASSVGTLHAQLGAAFHAGYAAKGEISVGCAAVQDDVRINEAEYVAFWNFGTANPTFDPRGVCPF
jgi:hypothetical protein